MVEDDYKVKLEIFEGPLDLLLYLIKKDEIDIYEISIERITKQYMDYLETFKLLNINLAGEFIVMASNLMYLKSRSMLPVHSQPPEEDADEEDPKWELIRQLIEYKKFKDAAEFLHDREQAVSAHFTKTPEIPETDEGPPPLDAGIFDLIQAFQTVLSRFEKEETFDEIVDDRWTVNDRIGHLLEAIAPGESIRFSKLFEAASSKSEVIVTFLALLELMKLRHFRAVQDRALGDIDLHRCENL